MASPPPSHDDLRHPAPDLQSLQGAYVGNIERLEERAERMSESGSDLQEEIRKTYSELKLVESRRSSLYSTQVLEDRDPPRINTRSRGVSIGSHANSIVDLNGNARWGGYSPGGHVTSPVGSLRSATGSNPPASIRRQRSGSKASRLGQVVHPEEVKEEEHGFDTYPASPQSLQSAPLATQHRDSPPPQEQRKVSSFTRIYDEVANGLPEELRNSVIMGQTPPRNTDRYPQDDQQPYPDASHLPDRPPTAASTDTTYQARTLWQDFDGAHCPDTVPEESEPSHSGHSRNPSRHSSNMSFMMRSHTDLPAAGAPPPPPEDGMVFYPAPVPKMLNLPKRLSQLPASNVQHKRRTQLLESMQSENRKSMPLPGEYMADSTKPNNRTSRQSLMALPPQLRASAYFDGQAAPTQEFDVKGESAERTLESILDASARAPVSAFTDHPLSGQGSNEIYGPEHKRKSSKLPEVPPTLQERRRRSSFNILDTNHNSSGDKLKKLKKRNSSADMNLLLVKASESRMSLGAELEERDEDARGPSIEQVEAPRRSSFEEHHGHHPDEAYEDEDEEGEEPEEPQYGAPTTLLAELQLRKAKQKTRNMNYVTLMEQGRIDGRHTLLQLNDLAEIEKQKRLRKKVNLAWEAPAEDDDSDDDVPLGVLYKQQPGPVQHRTGQQSMGLLAQRELEDTEPLSSRRSRLQGGNPNQRRTQHLGSTSQLNLAVPTTNLEPSSDEDEGETLADRMRRLKEKQTRDHALGGDDLHNRTVSGDFASEMMSKFGAPEDEQKPAAPGDDDEEEEETLGQRRARLQAEAAAQQHQQQQQAPPTSRPNLRSATSLADILAANPIDPSTQARKITNEKLVSNLPEGSLLHQSVLDEEKRKRRLNATMRASSYGSGPLLNGVNREKDDDDIPLGMKLKAYQQGGNPMVGQQNMGMGQQNMGMMGGGMQMPMQNPQMMGGMMPGMQQPMMPGMQNPQMMHMGMQNPQMMRQSMMMPMNGMPMQMPPMGMNGMPMGMGMGMMQGPPMDPRQRDKIDRWMQGIRN